MERRLWCLLSHRRITWQQFLADRVRSPILATQLGGEHSLAPRQTPRPLITTTTTTAAHPPVATPTKAMLSWKWFPPLNSSSYHRMRDICPVVGTRCLRLFFPQFFKHGFEASLLGAFIKVIRRAEQVEQGGPRHLMLSHQANWFVKHNIFIIFSHICPAF